MPGFIGMPELLLLGIVTLLVFGPKRLPEMGRSLGRGFREFKDSVTSDSKDEPVTVDEIPELTTGSSMTSEQAVTTPENGKVTSA